MKRIKAALMGLFLSTSCMSQNEVSWSYLAKKVEENKYELHLTVKVQDGWHIYSTRQPKGAIAMPTIIKFNVNPLIKLVGILKEVGTMQKVCEPTLGTLSNQYADSVDFVQAITLNVKKGITVKTSITGKLTYQICTDDKCLPPKTVNFSIQL